MKKIFSATTVMALGTTTALLLVAGCPATPTGTDGGEQNNDAGANPDTDSGTERDGGSVRDAGDDPDPISPDGGVVVDQCSSETNKTILAAANRVINGTRTPTHVPLDASQQLAVVGIGFGSPRGASCSGTLISENVVLTALHCTEGEPANSMFAIFGTDDTNPVLSVRAVAKHENPNVDLALLVLQEPPARSIAVTPIPIDTNNLTNNDFGIIVEQAGYGQTETGDSNGRFFVAELLDSFEEPGGYLVVNGENRHGVCFGDSGGPSMRITPQGDVRVLGCLSYGDQSCVGFDRYTRVDKVRAFIENVTGPTPTAGPVPCGDVDEAGTCSLDGSISTYCSDGILQREVCAQGSICADSGAGNRCIPISEDPCQGVSTYGQCDGEVLQWCNNGRVVERNCESCGERCILADDSLGFACVTSDCGDLDFQGRCDGEVAEWCNAEGKRESRDCAADGLQCGFINDEIGFFCGR